MKLLKSSSIDSIIICYNCTSKGCNFAYGLVPKVTQSVFWQAQFDTKFNADMKIKVNRGFKINTAAAVAAGQADFGLQATDSVMQSKGAGLVAIFANLNQESIILVFPSQPK